MTKTIPEARAVTAIRQVSDLNQLALTLHRWGRAAGLHLKWPPDHPVGVRPSGRPAGDTLLWYPTL